MRTRGVLLAGGRGQRLGAEVPKALVRVGGTTLLERALATLAEVCDEVVVAAPRTLDLPVPAGARRVCDEGRGPLDGLVASLAEATFQGACVLGVDFPLMTPTTLAALLAPLTSVDPHPPIAVVPAPDDVLQPLAAAYAPAAAAALAAAFDCGERSVVRAVRALDPRVLGPRELAGLPGGAESFFNLNTAADLAVAERRLRERVGSR